MFRNRWGQFALLATLSAMATQSLFASEFACSQEAMAGAWASSFESVNLERDGINIFPPPGPFVFAGLAVVDEGGSVLVERRTNTSVAGSEQVDSTQLFDSEILINEDCTGQWTFRVGNLPADHPLVVQFGLVPGEIKIQADLVCFNGQRECVFVSAIPEFQVGLGRLQRIAPYDDKLQRRTGRMMRTLGLVP